MAHHSSSRRSFSLNPSMTHPTSLSHVSSPFVQKRPHVTQSLAPESNSEPAVPEEGVVSGGGGGGGGGWGSGEGMGEAPSIEDAEGGADGPSGSVQGGQGKTEAASAAKSGGDYGDVSKYHPAWEGFGKGPSSKGGKRDGAKL